MSPRKRPVKMTRVTRANAENAPRFVLGHGQATLPYDLPVEIGVNRFMGDQHATDEVRGAPKLLGWSIDLKVFGFDSKVEIKISRKPKLLTLWVDDNEVARVKGAK